MRCEIEYNEELLCYKIYKIASLGHFNADFTVTKNLLSIHLKPKLLEEVTASSSLLLTGNILLVQVPILKDFLQSLLHIHLLLHQISLIHSLLQVHIHLVTGGEHMSNIDVLHKRLHGTRALLDLLLGHAAGDFAGSTGDSGDEAVGETFVVVVAVFDVFDDNCLLAGVTTSKDNDNFSGFDDGHFGMWGVC